MAISKLQDVMSSILEISPETVNENLTVDTCDTWDSMNHMNLILALEEAYHIKIGDDVAMDLLNYTDIRKYLTSCKIEL